MVIFIIGLGKWFVANTGSGNGLLPDGTKPLPEPLLSSYKSPSWEHISMKFYL